MKKYLLLVFAMIYTLTGCSDQTAQTPGGTVAAKVNGVEITKNQVNYLFDRTANAEMSPEASAVVKKRILEQMIQVELLAQKGKEMGLEKSQNFIMERYLAEKKTLAALAENKLLSQKGEFSEKEVDDFIRNNPPLFAQRKLYLYETVMMGKQEQPVLDALESVIKKGATLDQLVDVLNSRNVSFSRSVYSQGVDKIPAPIFEILNRIRPNQPQLLVFNQKEKDEKVAMIMVLHQTFKTPLVGVAAQKMARQVMGVRRRQALMGQEMRELVEKADITYYGEFSKTDADASRLSAPGKSTK